MKTKEFLSTLLLLTLAISIPLVAFTVERERAEWWKKAMVPVGPASLMLLPDGSGEGEIYQPGEEFDINVILNTGTEEGGGGNVYMFYATLDFRDYQDKIEVIKTSEGKAVTVPEESPFTEEFTNQYINGNSVSNGIVNFIHALPLDADAVTAPSLTIGTVRFRVKDSASGTASVQFLEENIIKEGRVVAFESSVLQEGAGPYDPGVDILGTVHRGNYTIKGPDTIAPETEITKGPSEGETITTSSTSFTFSGSDNETATEDLVYSWVLEKDGIGYMSREFSKDTQAGIGGLPTANYTFKVKAKDETGNEDSSPATRNFGVDLGECTPGETRGCTAANTCAGEQTCGDNRTWKECVTEENHCDEDCDGTPETCELKDCTECTCVGEEKRGCTTEDNFRGTQTCAEGTWKACEKDEPHKCASDYKLCDDDVCLLDCGECVPEETHECVTSDHFKGTKTCTSARSWGECIKGTDCEDDYTKCPDGTCQEECPAAALSLTFKLEGRAHAKKDPIKIFARESGSDANFGQAPWKQNLTIETDSAGFGSVSGLSLEGLDAGKSYEFLLQGPQHLQKKKTIASLKDENSLDFGLLQAGDLNGNHVVGGDDISIWVHEIEGEKKEEYISDINADGVLNGADVSIIIHNLKLRGDE